MDEVIKNRIRKIHALASGGIDGEKANAEDMLDKLLRKYGFDINDILDDKQRTFYEFGYKTKRECELLIHVYMKIRPEIETCQHYPRNRKVKLELSRSEYVEVKIMWNAYKKELQEQLEITFLAFLKSQNLLTGCKKSQESQKKLSPEKIRKWRHVYDRSCEIDKINVLKELPLKERDE